MPKLPFQEVFTISVGAIFGANARYFVSRYCAKVLGPEFPYGTLLINVIGMTRRRPFARHQAKRS